MSEDFFSPPENAQESALSRKMSSISPSSVQKFRELWQAQYGETLTDEEAKARATDLLNLFKILTTQPS